MQYIVSLTKSTQAAPCNNTVRLHLTLQYICSLAKQTTVYRHRPVMALYLQLHDSTSLYSYHDSTGSTPHGQHKEQKHSLAFAACHATKCRVWCSALSKHYNPKWWHGTEMSCAPVRLTCCEICIRDVSRHSGLFWKIRFRDVSRHSGLLVLRNTF